MAYDLSNLNILLVEDDRSMRALIRDLLNAFGVGDVATARNGWAAYQQLHHYAADIAIVDWLMEPMDGLEFIKRIRAADDSPNPFLPIIMLTAFTDEERVIACREAGVTGYLAKPIMPRTLYSRIEAAIEDQRRFVRSEDYFGPERRGPNRPFSDDDSQLTAPAADSDVWTIEPVSVA